MESTKKFFLKLYLTFWFVFVSLSVLLVAVVWIIDLDRDDDYDLFYLLSNTFVVLAGYFCAFFFPNKGIKAARKRRGLKEKLVLYRHSVIIRWMILLLVGIYSVFSFIMTKEYFFVCSALFTLSVLIVCRPSVKTLVDDLRLTDRERVILRNPESAI